MAVITSAYRQGRTDRAARTADRPRRDPLLAKLGRFLGRRSPSWSRVRTAVLQIAGLGAIDCGVYEWHRIAGLIAVGVSLLVLETFSGGDQ